MADTMPASAAAYGAHDIPAFLARTLADRYDAATVARIRKGYEAAAERPVTLRANTLKATGDEVAMALEAAGLAFERADWYPDAFVIGGAVRERALWDLDIYAEGKIYLQSLSSMLPPLALGPRAQADILDMCAAPGGKTSQMAALEPSAHITACELSRIRADKLTHNLAKLGVGTVQVMCTDARRLDGFFSFDQILLDAPCTGSGTVVAGDARAAKRITAALLDKVTRSQRKLLDRALTVLKPGATLVYSTCSILPQENEKVVRAALQRHRDCTIGPIEVPTGAPALETLPCPIPGALTVAPTRLFEGFFLCKIKKD